MVIQGVPFDAIALIPSSKALERRSVSLSERRIGGGKCYWARRERGSTSGTGCDLLAMREKGIAEEVINVDTVLEAEGGTG